VYKTVNSILMHITIAVSNEIGLLLNAEIPLSANFCEYLLWSFVY